MSHFTKLVGTDNTSGDEFGNREEIEGQRSDTTILAHLDADGTTTMVSSDARRAGGLG